MDKNLLGCLVGPLPMETPPIRDGIYAVAIRGSARVEMWFWNGTTWVDSEQTLGENRPAEWASGWYGQFQAVTSPYNDGLDDGLGL